MLAALPALAGGLLSWADGRVEERFAVRVPGGTTQSTQAPDQAPAGTEVAADPAPARAADPPADQGVRGDDDDRDQDDGSGGSGRSGGGGGGSSGPG